MVGDGDTHGDTHKELVEVYEEALRIPVRAPVPDEGPDPELVELLPLHLPRAKPDGRYGPSSWDRDKAAKVIEQVALGRTVTDVCADPTLPKLNTFRSWCLRVPKLREMYSAARHLQAASIFDEALGTARDNAAAPTSEIKNSAVRTLIETLKWAAGKLNPQEYGERNLSTAAISVKIITNLDLDETAIANKGLEPIDMEETEGIYTVEVTVPPPTTGLTPTGAVDRQSEATTATVPGPPRIPKKGQEGLNRKGWPKGKPRGPKNHNLAYSRGVLEKIDAQEGEGEKTPV